MQDAQRMCIVAPLSELACLQRKQQMLLSIDPAYAY